jgi:hypothetical protein
VKLEDFQITKFALARSSAWLPADVNLIDLASLQDMLAPGAKLPANAKVVKHKTDTAVISASASLFIIHSSLTLVNIQFISFLQGHKSCPPLNFINELTKRLPSLQVTQTSKKIT